MNKARLVAQGHTQEEGIDYEEVFAPVARIEAIILFLAYASFMGFLVYQMDVKSTFLYGTIEEEVYVCQPPRFEDPENPDKVYKVVKALYGLHQAPRACQDKYVAEILKKFRLSEGKSASTPIDADKPLLKDTYGEDVDVHTYRSMIGSLMYLTSSRPDIMFIVCVCARFQLTPKVSHLNAVKRIFRYLKGKPYLGLRYPKDSPFDLVAYSDSDYAGVSLDRKSTTRGCQFLGCRLISWQCKKQTVVATSSTEAEYVAATSGCYLRNVVIEIDVLSDDLSITTNGVNTPRSDEDRLKLMELMVFLLQRNVCVEIRVNAAHLSSYCCQANSDAAEGFEQIIDFLSGSYIHYALTVSPHIYISCIKQFWNSVLVKHSGDVTRLQALVDKKKIVISEAVIREILQLNDAEGVVCLPNEEIFAGLAQMGLVRKVDSSSKFYMYPRFIQLIIQTNIADLYTHTTRYISLALTQKVFMNMRRVGKVEVVSKVVPPTPTPPSPPPPVIPSSPPYQPPCPPQPQDVEVPSLLFQQVLDTCSALARRVKGLENDKAAQQLEIVKLKARVKKLEKINKGKMIADMDMNEGIELVKDAEVAESEGRNVPDHTEKQVEMYNIGLDHSSKVLSMQEDDTEVQEAVEIVTMAKLMTEVVTTAATQVIPAAKPKILNIAAAHVVSTRRRKRVVIRDPEEELSSDTPAETPKVKDKGKGILIEAPKPMKKKDQIEMDAEYARKLQEEINKEHEETYKNIDWNAALDHVQSKEPQYPLSRFTLEQLVNMARLQVEEESEMSLELLRVNAFEDFRTELVKGKEKRAGEELVQEITKKQKVEDDKEKAELKQLMETIPDEEEVAIDPIPLAVKSLRIVDWKIHKEGKKRYYQIARADRKSHMYMIFSQMLKSFDMEALEDLYKLVKARYGSTRPVESIDYLLWSDMKIMFEPHVEDESMQIYMLVEKKVNAFEDFRTELVKGKEKRAGEELVQEITKKQKVEDDKEKAELKQLMETIPDEEEVAIDPIPLAVKSLRIVDWKIHKEGKKRYYQIARADRKSHMYMIFSQMLKSFDMEALEDLYKLVKARYGSTRPVESIDYLLWSDMKIMFEPHVEDEV
nr:ribonuclease H-like domain, reverse transcriptase, RNA-dependent DNA polymerase [Tanacetum cinerariifolium]